MGKQCNRETLVLHDGDVIFTQQNTPSSFLIRRLQGDMPYSHVCIYMDGFIYTTGGYRKYWFGKVDAKDYLAKQTHIAVGRHKDISPFKLEYMKYALDIFVKNKIAYNTVGLLRLAYNGLVKGLARAPGHYYYLLSDINVLFCSESVAIVYNHAFGDVDNMFWQLFCNKPNAQSCTPEDLYKTKNGLDIVYDEVYDICSL